VRQILPSAAETVVFVPPCLLPPHCPRNRSNLSRFFPDSPRAHHLFRTGCLCFRHQRFGKGEVSLSAVGCRVSFCCSRFNLTFARFDGFQIFWVQATE